MPATFCKKMKLYLPYRLPTVLRDGEKRSHFSTSRRKSKKAPKAEKEMRKFLNNPSVRISPRSEAAVEERWPDGMREVLADRFFEHSTFNSDVVRNDNLFHQPWLEQLPKAKTFQTLDRFGWKDHEDRVELYHAWKKFEVFKTRIVRMAGANEATISGEIRDFMRNALGYNNDDPSSSKMYLHPEINLFKWKKKPNLGSVSETSGVLTDLKKVYHRPDFAVSIIPLDSDARDLNKRFREDNERKIFRLAFEIKKPSEKLDTHMDQVSDYLNELKIPWVILTNGTIWKLLCRHAKGDAYQVDISKIDNALDFRFFYYFFRAKAFGVKRESPTSSWNDFYFKRRLEVLVALKGKLPDIAVKALNHLAKICGIRSLKPHSSLEMATDNNTDWETRKPIVLNFFMALIFIIVYENRLPIEKTTLTISVGKYLRNYADATDDSEYKIDRMSTYKDCFRAMNEKLGGTDLFDVEKYKWVVRSIKNQGDMKYNLRALIRILYTIGEGSSTDDHGYMIDWASLNMVDIGQFYETINSLHPIKTNKREEIEFVLPSQSKAVQMETQSFFTPHWAVDCVTELVLDDHFNSRPFDEPKSVETILERILNTKVVDPACGSGHFLNMAVLHLHDRFVKEVKSLEDDSDMDEDTLYLLRSKNRSVLPPNLKSLIIKNCIHGVDLNPVSALVTRLTLTLTAEDDEMVSVFKYLDKVGIKRANSLACFEEKTTLKEGWEELFPSIFKTGAVLSSSSSSSSSSALTSKVGFDVVLMNPPWSQLKSEKEDPDSIVINKRFVGKGGNKSLIDLFIVLATSILLKETSSSFGFVIQDNFFNNEIFERSRRSLYEICYVKGILKFEPNLVFPDVNKGTVFIFGNKRNSHNTRFPQWFINDAVLFEIKKRNKSLSKIVNDHFGFLSINEKRLTMEFLPPDLREANKTVSVDAEILCFDCDDFSDSDEETRSAKKPRMCNSFNIIPYFQEELLRRLLPRDVDPNTGNPSEVKFTTLGSFVSMRQGKPSSGDRAKCTISGADVKKFELVCLDNISGCWKTVLMSKEVVDDNEKKKIDGTVSVGKVVALNRIVDKSKYRRITAFLVDEGVLHDENVRSIRFKSDEWNASLECRILLEAILNSTVVEFFFDKVSSSNYVPDTLNQLIRIPSLISWEEISKSSIASSLYSFYPKTESRLSSSSSSTMDAAEAVTATAGNSKGSPLKFSSTRPSWWELQLSPGQLCRVIIECSCVLHTMNLSNQAAINNLDMWIQYAVARLYGLSIYDMQMFFDSYPGRVGAEKLKDTAASAKKMKPEKVVQFHVGKRWIDEDVEEERRREAAGPAAFAASSDF